MASIRKRTWKTPSGETKSAWMLHYVDRNSQQQRRQFKTKKEADAERVRVEGELARGVHVADRNSITVHDAAKAFLSDFDDLVKAGKREYSTWKSYDEHVRLHIAPFDIAKTKLSRLNGPDCAKFAAELEKQRSGDMAWRAFSTLKTIIKFARTRGWIAANPAEAVSVRRTGERIEDKGVSIPSKEKLKALLTAAETFDDTGHAKAFVSLLLFGGLRISELRGLRQEDIKLKEGRVEIRQRADRWQTIGAVKSKNSRRSVPLPQSTLSALTVWMVKAPHSKKGLMFPNGAGNVESYANIYNRLWVPLMKAAGLANVIKSEECKEERVQPRFGIHTLRHAAVSLWIEQGTSPKKVMTWAGHASIQFTMDVYGHLWDDPSGDAEITKAAEESILVHSAS